MLNRRIKWREKQLTSNDVSDRGPAFELPQVRVTTFTWWQRQTYPPPSGHGFKHKSFHSLGIFTFLSFGILFPLSI